MPRLIFRLVQHMRDHCAPGKRMTDANCSFVTTETLFTKSRGGLNPPAAISKLKSLCLCLLEDGLKAVLPDFYGQSWGSKRSHARGICLTCCGRLLST